MTLYLIRHAHIAGAPFVCPPRPVSGCLSEEGVREARALREALDSARLDAALSSPYGRALQTAEIVTDGRNVPIDIVPGLEEWKPSDAMRGLVGTAYETLQTRDRERYAEETWKTELGEGAFDLYARVVPALLAALAARGWHHRMGGWIPDPGTEAHGIAIFAHGGSLNVMLSFLLGLQPFPVGRFSFDHTGTATVDFLERRGLYYPSLKVLRPAPHSGSTTQGVLP